MSVLHGVLARRARVALDEASSRFSSMRAPARLGPSLAEGHAGLALVHWELDRAFPGRGHGARAARALERAIDGVGRAPLSPSFLFGFTGIAWVIRLLRPDSGEEDTAEIDAALEAYVAQSPWSEPYDLAQGLVGICVYALECLPHRRAQRLLALAVDRLHETAEDDGAGVVWTSNRKWLPPPARRAMPRGWKDLGLSHGIAGVIGALGRIVGAPVDARTRGKARVLLGKAVAWLLAHELPPSSEGRFARGVAPGVANEPARLAWCNGDPGIAAALFVAARAARVPAWRRAALRIARRAAERSEATSGIVDAGFCHGASGVAHIFHRLHHASGDPLLGDAARRWFERVLQMRRPARGFAGFVAYLPTSAGKLAWRADPTFLTGAGGATLSLLATTTDDLPVWSRALLVP